MKTNNTQLLDSKLLKPQRTVQRFGALFSSFITFLTLLTAAEAQPLTAFHELARPFLDEENSIRLKSGDVLFVGGQYADRFDQGLWYRDFQSSSYLFDGNTLTYINSGVPGASRYGHELFLLSNAKVVLAGGGPAGRPYTVTSETLKMHIFDPLTLTWSPGPSLPEARVRLAGTAIGNGRLFLCGGLNPQTSEASASTYFVDPNSADGGQQVITANSMSVARVSHTATFLPGKNQILIVGGWSPGTSGLNTAEVYDLARGEFVSTANNLSEGRHSHDALLLKDGRVLIIGGYTDSTQGRTAEIYDPENRRFSLVKVAASTQTSLMSGPAGEFRSTLMLDGNIFLATTNAPEILNLTSGTFTPIPPDGGPAPRGSRLRSHLLETGEILVAGSSSHLLYRWPTIVDCDRTAVQASQATTIRLQVRGATANASVYCNGSLLQSLFADGAFEVPLTSAQTASSADIAALTFTVSENGRPSKPFSLAIVDSTVDEASVASEVVAAGETSTVATPEAPVSLTATFSRADDTGDAASSATVTVATYSEPPAAMSFEVPGDGTSSTVVDLQVSGAAETDLLTARFYYPLNVDDSDPAIGPVLRFYDPSATDPSEPWVEVFIDEANRIRPIAVNEDANLNGGYFEVTFSALSKPSITELTGTYFAFAKKKAPLFFAGFAAPLGGADETGGTFATPLRTFKLGSTIPFSFELTSQGQPVTAGVHQLQLTKYSSATTAGVPIDATPSDRATVGNRFEYSGGAWRFNLDTKATRLSVGIWYAQALLEDGSVHGAWIQLK